MLLNILDVTCNAGGQSVVVPDQLVKIISLIYNLIKIAIPILLIIFGMLDLGKAVIAQKEDDIKKGQQTFVKRLIAAAIVFFVLVIVQLVVSIVADDGNIWKCVSDLLAGK